MNIYQKEVLEILKSSLVDEKYKLSQDINLEFFKTEAIEHALLPLLYYYLDKENLNFIEGNECLNDIKKIYISSNFFQMNMFKIVKKISEDLFDIGIEIIILKGGQVREYYKRPELRTMGDIDILVKEEDFPKVREYLIAEGYKEEDDGHNIHRSFIMENGINFEIEVHWNVINEDYFSYDKAEFEDKLWINSISRGSYRILRIDELIVYLIMHMAVHARYSGFGIRQVYDIAIIDRVDRNKINWNNILAECHKYGMRKFAEGILVILNIYFDNKLPKEVMDFISVSEDDACELLEHIFESGVHGKRLENEDYLELSRYEYIKNKMSFIKRILRLFFPRKELIIEDYKYLKKLPILFPYACIHYDITKGLIKKYSLIENVGNIKYSIKLGKKRCRIIKLFDL